MASESSAPAEQPGARERHMSPKRKPDDEDDLLPEYDFSGAVRGKYYERYRQGTNVVLLDPDVAAVFRDSAVVNDTLRSLVSLAKAKVKVADQGPTRRRRRSPNKPLQPPSRAIRGARLQRKASAARG
jgi:hypothetical protein